MVSSYPLRLSGPSSLRCFGFKATPPLGESKSVPAESKAPKERRERCERRVRATASDAKSELRGNMSAFFGCPMKFYHSGGDSSSFGQQTRRRTEQKEEKNAKRWPLVALTCPLAAPVTPDGTRGGNYQVEIRVMSRPRPSEGTKSPIVLQIAPTGNSDNASRLGPIVAVISPCEQEAGFVFSWLLFYDQKKKKTCGGHGVIFALRWVRLRCGLQNTVVVFIQFNEADSLSVM